MNTQNIRLDIILVLNTEENETENNVSTIKHILLILSVHTIYFN